MYCHYSEGSTRSSADQPAWIFDTIKTSPKTNADLEKINDGMGERKLNSPKFGRPERQLSKSLKRLVPVLQAVSVAYFMFIFVQYAFHAFKTRETRTLNSSCF